MVAHIPFFSFFAIRQYCEFLEFPPFSPVRVSLPLGFFLKEAPPQLKCLSLQDVTSSESSVYEEAFFQLRPNPTLSSPMPTLPSPSNPLPVSLAFIFDLRFFPPPSLPMFFRFSLQAHYLSPPSHLLLLVLPTPLSCHPFFSTPSFNSLSLSLPPSTPSTTPPTRPPLPALVLPLASYPSPSIFFLPSLPPSSQLSIPSIPSTTPTPSSPFAYHLSTPFCPPSSSWHSVPIPSPPFPLPPTSLLLRPPPPSLTPLPSLF